MLNGKGEKDIKLQEILREICPKSDAFKILSGKKLSVKKIMSW